ncbi:hypothetical protein RJ640_015690 [Escallonia rubra]|uniref:NADP-dependent oxidoreductase domain-containing protein n=1 Tax=Escallonia rubra TaxID=112253 RepID=A0AA88U6R2_9ASTE|nr:hypothetical protein RJ640_015690 [Escallonia rubra]
MATIPRVKVGSIQKPMPVIGMGTSSYPPVELEIAKTAILEAIKAGYRHFDTAFAYGSEMSLGVAIAEALRLGLIKSRDELFITTKLFASFASRDQVVPAIKMSLNDHPEVIVKIDDSDQSTGKKSDNSCTGSNIRRESSYEFWKDGENGGGGGFNFSAAAAEDPLSRLISQFLSRQRDSGDEMSLDVDLEMDEIDRDQNPMSLPPIAETLRIFG